MAGKDKRYSFSFLLNKDTTAAPSSSSPETAKNNKPPIPSLIFHNWEPNRNCLPPPNHQAGTPTEILESPNPTVPTVPSLLDQPKRKSNYRSSSTTARKHSPRKRYIFSNYGVNEPGQQVCFIREHWL